MTAFQTVSEPKISNSASSSGGGSVINLQRYQEIFFRHPFLIVGTFLVLFLGAAGIMLSMPKQYEAVAQVQVDLNRRNAADLLPDQNPSESGLADTAKIATEMAVVQSGVVAREVLQDIGPPPPPPNDPGLGTTIRQAVAPITKMFKSLAPRRPHAGGETADDVQQAQLDELMKGLSVDRSGGGYVIAVTYKSTDPVWAAKAANAFVEKYQAQKAKAGLDQTQQASTFLNSTLADLAKDVYSADAAVAAYRASHSLSQAGNTTMTEQTITAVGQQLVTARADQAEAEARLKTATDQLAAGSNGEDVGEALASPVVQRLRDQRTQVSQRLTDLQARYGPKHPDVATATKQLTDIDGQIQSEIRRILSNLQAQAQVARQRTASLQASLGAATSALNSKESASVELNELLRKQDAARQTYQQYLERYKQTSAQQALPQTNSHILTRATPPDMPSQPSVPKSLAIALAFGLLGGIGVMVGADVLQGGFNTGADVERLLGIPAFGLIPDLSSTLPGRRKRQHLPTLYVVEKPLSVFTESFRTLRTSLASTVVDGRPAQVVAVTSALPAEGKTTTCVCLGRVAAMGGAKTVIVDCDVRRKSIDQVIGRAATVGLVEVLDGAARLEDALVKDTVSAASFLPIGTDASAQRDLFGSEAMGRLIAQLREQFDLILLDAPPVLLLADARELAQRADVNLLIARWRKTPVAAVRKALRDLSGLGATLAGVALTQVDVKQERSYYSASSHYNRRYMDYFRG